MKIRWFYIPLITVLVIGLSVTIDLIRISGYKTYQMLPDEEIKSEQNQIYADLVNEEPVDWSLLNGSLKFIGNEYDCSDFRLVNLIRILYEFGDQIPENTRTQIEDVLFGFRYWWDEPGGNSMCYWSENHQILFASAEYLVGQKYPDTVFSNSGMTGQEHMEKARKRIHDWMEMRWNYGFTEFYSTVYYKEDIGGMINLIDFAEDMEIVKKMEIIMDLLFYDVAAQNINNMFISVSGRLYENYRKGEPGTGTFSGVTEYFWGNGEKINPHLMYGLMTTQRYTLPPVITEIAKDSGSVVIKQNNGLNISELKEEGYYGTDDKSMMMQLGMEAFSNPEIVHNTMGFVRKNNMFSNGFLKGLNSLDFTLLRLLHLEPALVRLINPQSNGVAIQKGNTYTFKTKDYSLYTVQNYLPGAYGNQEHVTGLNIGNAFSIFHNHPAVEKDVAVKSPSYWVGYGHLPHVVQDSNVSVAIYNIPEKKGWMEYDLLDYTHAYFPKEQFDSVYITENYAMGKKGDTYCAFICKNPLLYREQSTDDLIQQGKQTFWITEAGSQAEDRSFGEFCQRILDNEVTFDPEKLILTYLSKGRKYQLKFDGDFMVNGQVINTQYDRFDSPYCKAPKKAENITFAFNGKSLHLNYDKMIRDFDTED